MKRRKLSHSWHFSYVLREEYGTFYCIVASNVTIGTSSESFADAVKDAQRKLLYVPDLGKYESYSSQTIVVDILEYNAFHESYMSHVFD